MNSPKVVRGRSVAQVMLLALSLFTIGAYGGHPSKQPVDSKMVMPAKAKGLSKSNVAALSEGSPQAGRLSSASNRLPDGSFYEPYRFEGVAGAIYRAALSSEDFNSYVIVADASYVSIAEDDDSGGDLNAAAIFHMPSSGSVTVFANTVGASETGEYQIRVDEVDDATAISSTTAPRSSLTVDQEVQERRIEGVLTSQHQQLDDGSHAMVYRFRGEPDARVRIRMSSSDFDTFLIAMDANQNELASNDDAHGTDSDVTFRIPQNGEYIVVANSFDAGETGSFVLTAEQIGAPRVVELPAGNRTNGRYAMVVSVAEYANPQDNLPLVANDSKAMISMLRDQLDFEKDYVYVLEDDMATRENILNGIADFLGRAGPDGTVLFYFSGHGTRMEDNLGLIEPWDIETDGRDEALVAHDELILDDEMGVYLQRLNAGRIMVIYDSCHAGTGVRGDHGQPKFLDEQRGKAYLPVKFSESLLQLENFGDDFKAEALNERITFIASSTEEELSWVSNEHGMSIFTYMVTAMLSRYLDRTVSELEQAMIGPVMQYTTATFGQQQTPNVESESKQVKLREILDL